MKIGNLEVYGVIYKITNIINGKVYIGQTVNGFDNRYSYKGDNIEKVYKYHIYNKNNNRYYNDYLLNSIKKYGFNNFEVNKIFDIAFSKEELDIKEDLYIKQFNCIKHGYNWQQGGSKGKLSYESKKKISKSKTGKKLNLTKEQLEKKKMLALGSNNGMYGKKHSQYTKDKISNSLKGKFTGEKSYWFGKHLLESSKNKIRESRLGKSYKNMIVYCYTTNNIYSSIKQAGNNLNIDRTGISRVINGRYKQTNGFTFKKLEALTPEEYMKYDIENKLKELHNQELRQAI